MRRGRLTALAPSRTLLEGFDKGSRAVLATALRKRMLLNRDHLPMCVTACVAW